MCTCRHAREFATLQCCVCIGNESRFAFLVCESRDISLLVPEDVQTVDEQRVWDEQRYDVRLWFSSFQLSMELCVIRPSNHWEELAASIRQLGASASGNECQS